MAQSPSAPILFDRALLQRRQDRAGKLGPVTFLLDRVVEDMADRLQAVTRKFDVIADVWSPGDVLHEVLRARGQSVHVLAADHAEVLPLAAASLDLAVSALAFQFVNDLPDVLAQIRRA